MVSSSVVQQTPDQQSRFTVNGVEVVVDRDLGKNLNSVIKAETNFKGTKIACAEGGCGACAVEVSKYDASTDRVETRSINSCLCPVGSLDGCAVTTSEGIGSSKKGFSEIQDRFAEFSASQCGFCTPGFVVATHHALSKCTEKGVQPTADALQKGMDGNLCRCTGYRPILDACKALVSGVDMEDLGVRSCSSSTKQIPAKHAEFPSDLKQYVKEKAQAAANSQPAIVNGTKQWLAPKSLQELFRTVKECSNQQSSFRLIAGNTGAGVYHDWPLEQVLLDIKGIPELNGITQTKEHLILGANVTQTQAIEELQKPTHHQSFHRMADHLLRIAGTHVRSAATLGGNLVLARNKYLESDVTTILMAAGVLVQVASQNADDRWLSVEQILDPKQDLNLGRRDIVVAIRICLPGPTDSYWSHKLSQRFWNAHAIVNLAVWLRMEPPQQAGWKERLGVSSPPDQRVNSARVVIGCARTDIDGHFQSQRATAVEKALVGSALDVNALLAALEALPESLHPSPTPGVSPEMAAGAAEGLLLSALGPMIANSPSAKGNAALQQMLAVQSMGEPPVPTTRHVFPDHSGVAPPVALPVEKDRVRLQTSGEAVYVADVGISARELFAAPVESARALAKLGKVDPSDALKLPGVVAFIGPDDVPNGEVTVCDQVLFARDKVEYHGQPVGLIVAKSQVEAERGAQAVEIDYIEDGSLGQPILSIQDAIKANSYLQPPVDLTTNIGDAAKALSEAEHIISNARYRLPSQQHFYMEPQGALVLPDEDGTFTVTSSTQNIDAVQKAVADVLGLPMHKITAVCRRVGGGFGGKASRPMLPAAACAVAAHKLGKQVRLSYNRNTDFRQNGGRSETEVEYSVGFDSDGLIQALDCKVWCLGGTVLDICFSDIYGIMTGLNQVYELPNLHVEGALVRTNLVPRTIVRGPGFLNAVMIAEQVVEHIAAYLGLDGTLVRERNFMRPNTVPPQYPVLRDNTNTTPSTTSQHAQHSQQTKQAQQAQHTEQAKQQSDSSPSRPETALASSNGVKQNVQSMGEQENCARQDADDDPRVLCGRYRLKKDQVNDGSQDAPAGRDFPEEFYTLPQVWEGVKEQSGYAAKVKEFEEFNRVHVWTKRGVAMTPTRFDCAPPPMNAAVSVYADGSVTVTHGGIECGQGLSTKVKQMAAYALGQLLPEDQQPFPMDKIHINDTRSDIVPNAGPTWSSTSSEGCVAAIEQACAKLCRRLEPHLKKKDDGFATWQATIKEVQDGSMYGPSSVLLSAYGFYDGTERDADGRTTKGAKSSKSLTYTAFGAACSEVEINLLTGEKTILRSDLYFDCGRSLNPAVDIGQIEGAFIMGMGLCTSEEVIFEAGSGKLHSDSTWTYKIPTAADIPRQFNVTFLKNSPKIRSVMSSKASGEPSMMLSVSVLYALRRAVAAARNSLSDLYPQQLPALQHSGAVDGVNVPGSNAMHSSTDQMCTSYIIGGEQGRDSVGQGKGRANVPESAGQGQGSGSHLAGQGRKKGRGNAFLVLEAPVTTAHLKEAVGQFSVAQAIRAAVGKEAGTIADSRAEPEYHSSGEWVFVH